MSLNDLMSMAVRNLWKRKLRTFLTVLGVIIGTASIVVMISIGVGMNEIYTRQVSEWGSLQVITVSKPGNYGMSMMVGGSSSSSSQNKNKKDVEIDAKAIQTFKEIPGVITATPVVRSNGTFIAGKYVSDYGDFIGIDPSTFDDLGYTVSEGRGLKADDKNVVVMGEEVAKRFYNPKLSWEARYNSEPPEIDLFNEKTQITFDYQYGTRDADKSIKPTKVEVVGIISGNSDLAYSIFMPMKDVEKFIQAKEKHNKENSEGSRNSSNRKKSGTYDSAYVRVQDIETVKEVQQQIKDMGYDATSLTDILDSMKETTKMLSLVLGAIGGISLIIAAIGITNTMVMSIYERTREIGVMKVIGASLKDIKKLFLTEAAIIGFMGGLLGLSISFVVSKGVNYVAAMQDMEGLSSIPLWLYLSALAFATFVGVASGYFPAKRAMKLSALTAIKTE